MTSMPLCSRSIGSVAIRRSLKIDCRSLRFSATTSLRSLALEEPSSNSRRMSGSESTRVSDSSARFLENVRELALLVDLGLQDGA